MRGQIESRLVLYAVVVCLAGLLAGCATTSETDTIQQNLAILNERQAAMESRVQNAEGVSQRGGDLYSRIDELQTKMRTLNGRLEELEHKLDQLQRAQASAVQGQAQQPAVPPPPVVMEEGPAGFASAQATVPGRSAFRTARARRFRTGRGPTEQERRAVSVRRGRPVISAKEV